MGVKKNTRVLASMKNAVVAAYVLGAHRDQIVWRMALAHGFQLVLSTDTGWIQVRDKASGEVRSYRVMDVAMAPATIYGVPVIYDETLTGILLQWLRPGGHHEIVWTGSPDVGFKES